MDFIRKEIDNSFVELSEFLRIAIIVGFGVGIISGAIDIFSTLVEGFDVFSFMWALFSLLVYAVSAILLALIYYCISKRRGGSQTTLYIVYVENDSENEI